MKKLIVVMAALFCIALIGCQSFLAKVTPSEVAEIAVLYADVNEVWPTLDSARKVRTSAIIKHRTKQLDLLRLAEDDRLAYQDAIDVIQLNISESEAFQGLMVGSETQPLSILGILAGAGVALPIGLMKKRRGDSSPEEVEVAVAKAKNGG